jgi:DNA polymerase III alpha subunit
MSYIELHTCSAFSFLRAASFPEQLAEVAAELEMPVLALLDRNGVYGAQRFSVAAREHGVRPITGGELSMEDGGILPVLVENRTGYKNLCELLTQAHLRSEKGNCAIQWNELPQFAEGLVALLGSAGCQPAVCGSLPQTSSTSSHPNTRGVRQAAGRNRLAACAPQISRSPLVPMTLPERVRADYETMNLTTGPHPMKLLRKQLTNTWRAIDLQQAHHGATVQIAGNVICRQRPGTAKGFVFISLEDETGVSNAIVDPDLFERFRLLITEEAFLLIEGEVQNSDGVVLIKTREIRALAHEQLIGSESHDFH